MPQPPLIGELDSAVPARSLLEKVLGRRQTYEKYSPSDLKKIAQKYLSDIGLGEGVTFSSEAFDKHAEARAKDFNGLEKAKAPGDTLIHKKLSEASEDEDEQKARDNIKEAINQALEVSQEFKNAQEKYTESARVFNELVEKTSKDHNVQDIIGVMEDLVEEGRKAIKDQQEKEIEDLTEKFDNNQGFRTDLKTALNITDAQIEEVKNSLLENLKETQQKQIEEFNKSTQESIRTLHNAAANQRKAFLFIASLHNNDAIMRREIEKYAEDSREKDTENKLDNDLEIDMADDKTDIKSVNLDQLKFIQLLGGGKIKRQTDEAGKPVEPVSYKLEFGARLFNPRYLGNDRHQRDFLIMAQAVRASGSKGIIMKLNFSNEETAQVRAREAFKACIKSGFPPSDIKLCVNGKWMTYQATEKNGIKYGSISEELYAKKPNKYNDLLQVSEEIRQELNGITSTPKGTSKTNITALKTELEQLRQEAKNKPVPPEPEPSTITLTS
jgi:hypothetical protein